MKTAIRELLSVKLQQTNTLKMGHHKSKEVATEILKKYLFLLNKL